MRYLMNKHNLFKIIGFIVVINILPSCVSPNVSESPLLINWKYHFIPGEVPSDWEAIQPESGNNCVYSWKKEDVRVHMYIYEMMESSIVLSEVSKGMDIVSEPRIESITNYAMSIDGIRDDIFTRYVVIPSETGKSTFAFSYFQRVPENKVENAFYLPLLTQTMIELTVFHKFITEFQVVT